MGLFSRLNRWLHRGQAASTQSLEPPNWDVPVRERGFIPIFQAWVGAWALTPDHQPVFLPDDEPGAIEPIVDPRERNIALHRAAERYPELAHLRPQRSTSDPDCPHCEGTGQVRMSDGAEAPSNVHCYCGNLGWLPVGYVDLHRDPDV